MKIDLRMHACCAALLLAGALGCTENTAREQGYLRQTLPDMSVAQVFEPAKLAFSQYLSIDTADPADGVIRSRPVELNRAGEPQRIRDALTATPSRRRAIGVLRLVPRGSDVIAMCHVSIQRLDTAEYRAFSPQTGDDRPAYNSPFEAEAGASAAQREAWTDVGRHRQLEQQILESLRTRLEGREATTRPAP